MHEFTLSKPLDKALPSAVKADGSVYNIRTDFRVVLRILRMLEDPKIPIRGKKASLCQWFFRGAEYPRDPYDAFIWFLLCGEEIGRKNSKGHKDYDYEFDAPEIYASFLTLYQIDLTTARMHWWQFQALLRGALQVTTPLSEKVSLRKCNPDKCENPAAAREAQRAVQIPVVVSGAEKRRSAELAKRLERGEGIADLLKG